MYHLCMEDETYLTEWDDDGNEQEIERSALESRWPAPLSVDVWPCIEGVCDGEALVFDYGGSPAQPERHCVTKPGLIRRFVRLAGAPTSRIADFAREWGALSLRGIGYCDSTHPPIPHWEPLPAFFEWCPFPRELYKPAHSIVWEPVDAWRHMAKDIHLVLTHAGKLTYGVPFDDAEADFLRRTGPYISYSYNGFDDSKAILATARIKTLQVANEWMGAAEITPIVTEEGFALHTHSLGAALALQLALVTVSAQGFVACYECGDLFAPTRRPRHDRHTFCPRCQKQGVAGKHAERARQERIRSGKIRGQSDSHLDSQEGK